MKSFQYRVEGGAVFLLMSLFRVLPLDAASAIGGFIGRTFGARLSVNRKALRNIKAVFPGKTDGECRKIINDMWDNLGRTFAEYPHLYQIGFERMAASGVDLLEPIIPTDKPFIIIGGHLGNWETAAVYGLKVGIELDLIYRAPNNPYVDKILQDYRSLKDRLKTYPKSSQGMRQVVTALKSGRRIGILIDQKYNQGMETLFFGRPAMTSPAFAQLAQKFDCPLHPARVERIKGANFRLTVYPAIETRDRTLEDIISDAQSVLEQWITEHPGQWLWLHNRWKNKNAL